jgi:hypothetical protein
LNVGTSTVSEIVSVLITLLVLSIGVAIFLSTVVSLVVGFNFKRYASRAFLVSVPNFPSIVFFNLLVYHS